MEKFEREEIDVNGDLIQSRAKRVIETSVTCLLVDILMLAFTVLISFLSVFFLFVLHPFEITNVDNPTRKPELFRQPIVLINITHTCNE